MSGGASHNGIYGASWPMSCPRLALSSADSTRSSAGAVQETFQLFDRSAMMAGYQPDPKILDLGPDFFDPVEPARFPQCLPRYLNRGWSDRIGLDLGEDQWAAHFCRFEPLPGNLRSRWRCVITATSSACTIPRSATAAASCSPSCAMTAAACSTSAPRARARRPTAATPTAG